MDEKEISELLKKITQLEQAVTHLLQNASQLKVEHLHLHHPKIDHLTFSFDKVEVDEVSGALNIGNNFGVRVEQQAEKDQTTQIKVTTEHGKVKIKGEPKLGVQVQLDPKNDGIKIQFDSPDSAKQTQEQEQESEPDTKHCKVEKTENGYLIKLHEFIDEGA